MNVDSSRSGRLKNLNVDSFPLGQVEQFIDSLLTVSISVASNWKGRHVMDTTPRHTVSAPSEQQPPLRVFIPTYLRVERHRRSAAALGGLQTITRTSEPPRSRTSALGGLQTLTRVSKYQHKNKPALGGLQTLLRASNSRRS